MFCFFFFFFFSNKHLINTITLFIIGYCSTAINIQAVPLYDVLFPEKARRRSRGEVQAHSVTPSLRAMK
uniref:Uncharacterized protein n=1 Tax=Rhipicephalus microplus TaxID=6941 RepID=A0A6M2DEP8_RHIMP